MSLKLGNTDIAGTQVLYSTTGNNTDGAMTQAATTTELDNCVHKTGDETISGVKTVDSNIISNADRWNIISQHNNITLGSAPSSNIWTGIQCQDSSNTEYGLLGVSYRTTGEMWAQIMATLGSTQSAIRAIVDANNKVFTYAPSSDVNNSIVTTVNKSKANRGYFQLGNGMIVQWGLDTIAANVTTANVTYPKAFTSASSYAVLTCHRGASQTQSMTRPANTSATGFTCNYNR